MVVIIIILVIAIVKIACQVSLLYPRQLYSRWHGVGRSVTSVGLPALYKENGLSYQQLSW